MDAPWKTYVCRYYHNGKWWGLDIVAESYEDAEARVSKLGNLQLQGELKMQFPARGPIPGTSAATGFLVRAIVAVRNWLWPSPQ